MDNVCHAIFLHETHLLIDSHIAPRVPKMYLRRLRSNIEAVMGLSTWHLCFKMCLEPPFHATKPRSTYISGQEPAVHIVEKYDVSYQNGDYLKRVFSRILSRIPHEA